MHCLELDDIEAIGKDTVWFPFEEVLTFIGSYVGDGGEDICAMGCAALDAISVVYTTLPCLVVHIKILEIVIKVDRASTEIATEKSGVGSKYGGDVNVSFSAKRDSNASLPFVKVDDDRG